MITEISYTFSVIGAVGSSQIFIISEGNYWKFCLGISLYSEM